MSRVEENRFAFIQNRCQICLYEKYRYIKNMQQFYWNGISRFIYFYDETVKCPICFERPFLPRMDRCGHLFCLTCLINFVQASNGTNVSCPFCKGIEIDLFALKRVVFIKNKQLPKVGDEITFELLVKDNPAGYPRLSFRMPKFTHTAMATTGTLPACYAGVSIDCDNAVVEAINRDLKILMETNMDDKLRELSRQSIESERTRYRQMLDLSIYEGKRTMDFNQTKTFNPLFSLSLKAMYPNCPIEIDTPARLFYQSNDYRNTFLTGSQTAEIIDYYRRYRRNESDPPILLRAKVIEVTPQRLVPFSEGSEIRQVSISVPVCDDGSEKLRPFDESIITFYGATVNMIKIDLDDCKFYHVTDEVRLRLMKHKKKFLSRARRIKRRQDETARLVAYRASINAPPSILEMAQRKSNRHVYDGFRYGGPGSILFEGLSRNKNCSFEIYGFNTCTIGLDCLEPNEDYPHAETCIHYCKSDDEQDFNESNQSSLSALSLRSNLSRLSFQEELLTISTAECMLANIPTDSSSGYDSPGMAIPGCSRETNFNAFPSPPINIKPLAPRPMSLFEQEMAKISISGTAPQNVPYNVPYRGSVWQGEGVNFEAIQFQTVDHRQPGPLVSNGSRLGHYSPRANDPVVTTVTIPDMAAIKTIYEWRQERMEQMERMVQNQERLRNRPPEQLDAAELAQAYPGNKLNQYMVPKKTQSQRELKNKKKMARKNNK